MKRRNFIKTTALASIPLALNGIPVMASSTIESNSLSALATAAANCDKVLVIIQMNGGNDGLNTVFPIDKWANLLNARSNILMNQNQILPLNNNSTTGLHPAMPELQNLYNTGKMIIVQGVSYPNPSYSHFRATDIWFSGADSNENLSSGWIGRSLDKLYPNFPNDYPTAAMPDPLAIQIGSTLPLSLQGPTINMGYTAPNPASLVNVINQITDPAPNSDYGSELTFLRLMKDQSNVYRTAIQTAYNVVQTSPMVTYPTNNSLADQLRIVAKLINGGLRTPIYIVNHPKTHDTHADQVVASNKAQGTQAVNLNLLSAAIGAFQQDLDNMGKANKVTGMTFSEFGRRIKSNSSLGTDHGSAAPVLFFGAALNTSQSAVSGTAFPVAGMIGSSPNIPLNATVNNQVPMQFQFKQIYASVMQDWLCMTESQTAEVLGGTFVKLPIFTSTLSSAVNLNYEYGDFFKVYPNPVLNNLVNIQFSSAFSDFVNVQIYSVQGTLIYDTNLKVTNGMLSFEVANFSSSGMYILQINYNQNKFYKSLIVN